MAIILVTPLSMAPAKLVCHLTRLTRKMPIAFPGVAACEGFDPQLGAAQRDHVEAAYYGTAHGGFVDAVMRQHAGLAFGCTGSVAAHGREEKRPHSLCFPVIDYGAHNYGDIRDAPAADTDGHARSLAQAGGETTGSQFVVYGARDIAEASVGEVLADGDEHDETILNSA